jgi:uncharacterized membrane protein
MKKEYLDLLNDLLSRYDMSDDERNEILNDYNEMYDNWTEKGMSHEEVEEKLGKPKSIIGSLVEGYRRIPKPADKRSKFIAVTPFISLVIFAILAFGFNEYLYSWMAFLLIPMSAIVLSMTGKEREHVTTALSPFVTAIVYYILGMHYGLWHPGWLIFLLIPVLGVFNSRREMDFMTLLIALSPFAAVTAFIFIGEEGYYNLSWLVFFVIPFLGAFKEKTLWKKVYLLIGIPVGVAIYYYFATTTEEPFWSLFAFSHLAIFGLLNGNIVLFDKDTPKEYKIVIVGSVVTYVIISLLTGWWAITWLVFLSIPVFAIMHETEQPERTIALTPFISLTIFMLVGFFLGYWVWAAFAFLLIPVTAIIKSA